MLVIKIPSVGQAGLEPARFFLIRGVPLPSWPLARGSERGVRIPDHPVMSGPLCRLSYLAMVGRRGVEPRCTCLSDRARRPAGSRPAEGGGPDPQALTRPVPLQTGAGRPAGSPSRLEESGGPDPQRLRPPAFEAGPAALAGSLSTAEDGDPDSHALPGTTPFPAGAGHLPGSSSMRGA